MRKKRLSKVCRSLELDVPTAVRVLNACGFRIMRKPNTKLNRLQRAVLYIYSKMCTP